MASPESVLQSNRTSHTATHRRNPTRQSRSSQVANPSTEIAGFGCPCIDPEERKHLVDERDLRRPHYVYLLWVATQRKGTPKPVPGLFEIYSSSALAKHDAACWVIQMQNLAGAPVEKLYYRPEYEEESEGQCCYYFSHEDVSAVLNTRFTAWTTRSQLR